MLMHPRLGAAIVALILAAGANAEDRLKPFVLAARAPGDLDGAVAATKQKLAAAGLDVAGSYTPYEGAVVLAVTSPALKDAAARSRFGGYAAAQRVTLTRVDDEVQTSYTNPVYMQHAYRMAGDLAPVARALEAALGRTEEYGPADGRAPKDLHRYHYMVGMPYFDEPWKLASFETHAAAVEAVAGGLAQGRGGTRLVYRVDVPATEETVFGVGLSDGCGGDAHVMKEIDFKPVRSTGHLPYEVLVSGKDVFALHAKFRIAVNFPDLKMMGSHSFMNIRCAPGDIEGALKKVVAR
jgi:hypothetical protein